MLYNPLRRIEESDLNIVSLFYRWYVNRIIVSDDWLLAINKALVMWQPWEKRALQLVGLDFSIRLVAGLCVGVCAAGANNRQLFDYTRGRARKFSMKEEQSWNYDFRQREGSLPFMSGGILKI